MPAYIPEHSILNRLDLSEYAVTPKPKDLPEDRSWEELNEVQSDTREGLKSWLSLVEVGVELYPSIEDEETKKAILTYGKQLVDRHNAILAELETLKEEHKGRTGGVTSEEDLVAALSLGGQYHDRVLAPFAGVVADVAIPLSDSLETIIDGLGEDKVAELNNRLLSKYATATTDAVGNEPPVAVDSSDVVPHEPTTNEGV